MKRLIATLLVSGCIVLGQSDSNSITITATRPIYAQPDQVLFQIVVDSGIDATLDSIVAALAASGIAASNLSSVSGSGRTLGDRIPGINLGPPLQWIFTLSVPLVKLKDTIASLTALQQTIAQKKAGLSMAFSVAGTQASPQQCSTADLISDARAQAQKLANAAGVSVGPILAVSEPDSAGIPTGAVRIGDFSTPSVFFVAGLVSSPAFFASTAPSNCSLTVKFAMLR